MIIGLLPVGVFAEDDPASKGEPAYDVGGDTFATLAEAIARAGSGETIKVLSDHTEEAQVPVAVGKSFVLDMNGKTLILAGLAPEGDTNITIQGTGGGTLKLSGTGSTSGIAPNTSKKVSLTVNGGNIQSDGLLLNSAGSGSSVTVTGGNIVCYGYSANNQGQGAISGDGISSVSLAGGSITVSNGMVVRAKNAAVTATGGTFKCEGSLAREIFREAKSLTISGGYFYR